MWQRFTERARRVVFFAQEEAARLGENYVSSEHLLLGLIREDDSVAARILDQMGISRSRIRKEVEREAARGDGRLGQDMQLTPRGKRVIDLAYDEARQLNNNYIGTEHLLLGLIREADGLGGRVLARVGANLDRARREVIILQDQDMATAPPLPTPAEPPGPLAPVSEADAAAMAAAHAALRDNAAGLSGRSLLSMADLSPAEVESLLVVGNAFCVMRRVGGTLFRFSRPRSLALLFEKPSLRTRVTFELGMQQMGGLTTVLGPAEIGLGTRESVPDAARNLERWVDCIMARVFKHDTLVGLRDNCHIPVINGLSDLEHPCQCLADLLTIRQHKGKLEGMKVAWVGDGYNVVHSLMLGGALTGMTVHAACPDGYCPSPQVVEQARALAGSPDRILLTTDPREAVKDADVVYTDTWTSMGQEDEAARRRAVFAPFQVNASLLAGARPNAIFMHCLPAHRGEEATDEVMDGPQSVIFDQAENRMHAQNAVLALVLGA